MASLIIACIAAEFTSPVIELSNVGVMTRAPLLPVPTTGDSLPAADWGLVRSSRLKVENGFVVANTTASRNSAERWETEKQ